MDFETIKQTLKDEFIGIDEQIEQTVESIKTWYETDLIKTPTIICLWGMTGSGKTALIDRLVDLLEYKDFYIKANLSDNSDLAKKLEPSNYVPTDTINCSKSIILVDEFQTARTIGSDGKESSPSVLKSLWNLLDTGFISSNSLGTFISHCYNDLYG